jgi:hypothetical protein
MLTGYLEKLWGKVQRRFRHTGDARVWYRVLEVAMTGTRDWLAWRSTNPNHLSKGLG